MDNGNIFYLNINLTNPGAAPIPAYVVDRRDGSIIDNPSEWEMSIVRFEVSSELIPLFYPVIPNPAFPTQTNMSITLAYGGVFFQEFINVTPAEAKGGVFDYSTYLNELNVAAAIAFAALKVAFPGSSGTQPPRFFLDDTTTLISMYVDDPYLDTNPNRITVGINQPLQSILDMPSSLRNPVPAPFGYDYELAINGSALAVPLVNTRFGYPVVLNPIAVNFIQVSQEFGSLDEWSQVKSLLFTSSLVPVNKEYLPNINTINQNNNVNDSFLPIVTDFDIAKDTREPTRHTWQYVPTAEYRMIGLKGYKPFSAIDITAQYQMYDGKYYPLQLASGDNMSLKIMFRRKFKK